VPMTKDTLFSLASMSKPLTTVGALRLVEEGRLMMDDQVGKHLPPLRQMQVAHVGPDGLIERVAPVRPITIRDLMRHTSGLTYPSTGAVQRLYQAIGFGPTLPSAEFIDRLATLPWAEQRAMGESVRQLARILGVSKATIARIPPTLRDETVSS
jgi:CubicO group peptidase (beta-lactamase class C family)